MRQRFVANDRGVKGFARLIPPAVMMRSIYLYRFAYRVTSALTSSHSSMCMPILQDIERGGLISCRYNSSGDE